MASPPEAPSPNRELNKTILRLTADHLWTVWRSRGFAKTAIHLLLLLKELLFSRFFLISLLCGAGVGFLLAMGQIYAIGFSLAWKIYRLWWIASPLMGPLFLLLPLTGALIADLFENISRRKTKLILGSVGVVGVGVAILAGGYKAAREDNPLLSSQPASLEAISSSVGEQNRILGGLSDSGVKLLGQLTATESELEVAKKQLAVTLESFDAQRRAAQLVTHELRQLGDRQKQITLQTEELERILGGQQPITRHDLERATVQGWISGLVVGFVASLLASIAYNALKKRRPSPPD